MRSPDFVFIAVAVVSLAADAVAQESSAQLSGSLEAGATLIQTIDLGTLHSDGGTEGRGINERGVVVGRAGRANGTETAFMWTQSQGFIPLADGASAEDINFHTEVVGWRHCNYSCPSKGSCGARTKDSEI